VTADDEGRTGGDVADADRASELLTRALELYAYALANPSGLIFQHDEFEVAAVEEVVLRWLMTRTYNTLLVAGNAVADGFSVQALILARSVYEDQLTARYVRHNPSEAYRWLSNPKKGPLRFKDMENAVGSPEMSDFYGFLSEYGHPRAAGLIAEFEVAADVPFVFNLGPRSEPQKAFAVQQCLLLLAKHALMGLEDLVPEQDIEWKRLVSVVMAKIDALLEA
jgi:hypothetical protein